MLKLARFYAAANPFQSAPDREAGRCPEPMFVTVEQAVSIRARP